MVPPADDQEAGSVRAQVAEEAVLRALGQRLSARGQMAGPEMVAHDGGRGVDLLAREPEAPQDGLRRDRALRVMLEEAQAAADLFRGRGLGDVVQQGGEHQQRAKRRPAARGQMLPELARERGVDFA